MRVRKLHAIATLLHGLVTPIHLKLHLTQQSCITYHMVLQKREHIDHRVSLGAAIFTRACGFINPRRACAARVTVLGLCLSVLRVSTHACYLLLALG